MKIAILTFHRAYNCGAMLQAWALQTVLERKGHEVVFPDCNDVGEWCKLDFNGRGGRIRCLARYIYENLRFRGLPILRKIVFQKFLNKHLKHKKFNENEWENLDLVVVGSDQVWNERSAGEKNAPIFIGEGIPESVPMVGYGISAGDKKLAKTNIDRLFNVGKTRFNKLSWRESSLRDILGLTGPVVCDPTLLLTKDDYHGIEHSSRLVDEPYLFVYAVSDADEIVSTAYKVAKAMKLKCIVADVYREDFLHNGKPNIWALPPDRFLTYIRDADAVIVSSFHGCVFSVLYGKPFVCLSGEETQSNEKAGRQQNLMQSIGLLDKRMTANSPIEKIVEQLHNHYCVDQQINSLRKSSYEYIDKMLVI